MQGEFECALDEKAPEACEGMHTQDAAIDVAVAAMASGGADKGLFVGGRAQDSECSAGLAMPGREHRLARAGEGDEQGVPEPAATGVAVRRV